MRPFPEQPFHCRTNQGNPRRRLESIPTFGMPATTDSTAHLKFLQYRGHSIERLDGSSPRNARETLSEGRVLLFAVPRLARAGRVVRFVREYSSYTLRRRR